MASPKQNAFITPCMERAEAPSISFPRHSYRKDAYGSSAYCFIWTEEDSCIDSKGTVSRTRASQANLEELYTSIKAMGLEGADAKNLAQQFHEKQWEFCPIDLYIEMSVLRSRSTKSSTSVTLTVFDFTQPTLKCELPLTLVAFQATKDTKKSSHLSIRSVLLKI